MNSSESLRPSQAASLPGKFLRDRNGASAVEFVLVLPLLVLLLFAIITFGIVLNNQLALTDGVRTAARELAISRGQATPYANALNRFNSSITGLNQGNANLTLTVNGTACSTDGACATALSTALGQPATASATYPCSLVVLGFDFASGCTLTAATAERIE